MTRQVVLDTETTGLNPKLGDRIVEVGCVEILNRQVGERHFHSYVNPERDIEEAASRVHGLTREDLLAKPRFAEIAAQFLDYVRGAEVIIHNADFDVEFLDLELGLAKLGRLADHVAKVTDTLAFARELHPGRRNSLDALCERYFIPNAHRTLHGALLDARLLAECYLAMTRGQESLVMELETADAAAAAAALMVQDVANLIVVPAFPEEAALHEKYLDALEKEAKAPPLWRRLAAAS
jgi:DNA polymerase III subunit epsilon